MAQPAFQSGDILGHYRLSEKIGSGGQGEVWRARDLRFERDVAVKILPEKALADIGARERFRREARAVGKLNHPNIATAHDFGDDPVEYLVTEYVSGSGLDQRLSGGPLPEDSVIALGIQLVSGLEAAHHKGIIHRDLKPGNLRIAENGTLKILDFGLAEMFDPTKDAASVETITLNMTLTGTLPYMAPEQFAGLSDQRSDLWSVGAVLYEMATGQMLFPGAKMHEVRDLILNSRPRPPREVNSKISAGLELVILRCLQKKPERRYQTATELREDLERLARGQTTRVAQMQLGRRFSIGALAAVLLLTGLTVGHYWPQIRQKLWPHPEQAENDFRLLAILPIGTTGHDASEDALVRGMAETVSAHLARATLGQKLQLIPPSELISRGAITSEAARREFGVERVLEVSVQHSGDKVRVTCSLIDPKTHQLLNACTVTGEDNDLFAIQDNLVGEVIAMLPTDARSPQTEPKEVQAAAPAGYEFYLKGKGYLLDYHKPENIDAAIKEFERALKVSPNYAPAYAGLGEAYWRGYEADRGKQWLDKAETYCEKSLSANPKLADGHACLGNLYNDTGKYQQAAQEFQRSVNIDHSNVEALGGLGLAYERMNDFSAAEEAYKKAIDAHPQYWAVYNWLGAFYSDRGRYSDAAGMFQKVIALTPDNFRGYSNLGAMYLLEGKYADAIKTLNRSIELSPGADAYSNLGLAYFYDHKYPEAVSMYEKARDLDDTDYLNWGNLGDALYWSPGRKDESFAAYRKGIELAQSRLKINPKDDAALSFVAMNSAVIGDKRTALTSMQKALRLAPTDPEVMYRAALVYNQMGDTQSTLNWLNNAVKAHFSRTAIRDTPDFAHLQSDSDFQKLVTGD